MTITSYGFLLLFLPLLLLMYWQTSHKLALLCAASYLFYALGGLVFIPLLLGLSLATYYLAQWGWTGWGITLNLLALAFFKYWNFGVDTAQGLLGALGISTLLPMLTLALPLGISFYVFKHIGYLLDVRAGRFMPVDRPLLLVTYSAFFPQISAGPMSIGDHTLKQLANLPTRPEREQLIQGVMFISIGLIKKVIIADPLQVALRDGLFGADVNTGGLLWAWCSVVMYAAQLYFDFSSYSDMALGIGALAGIELPPNFNNPYRATNPADFWQRWHISLSTWFRLYLFFPVSRGLLRRWGSGGSARAQYAANLVTMGLVGLWHGAGWGFVLWGLYHGLLLNAYAWGKRRKLPLDNRILLIFAVLIGWALFLSPDLAFAGRLFGNLLGMGGIGSFDQLIALFTPPALLTLTAACIIGLSGKAEAADLAPGLWQPAYALTLGALVMLCLMQLGGATQFIYVQF